MIQVDVASDLIPPPYPVSPLIPALEFEIEVPFISTILKVRDFSCILRSITINL